MLTTRLIVAFFVITSTSVFALDTEEQINQFIEQVEKPRLIALYPDAEIEISLNNLAALNYLPTCQSETLEIRNQRPGTTRRTNYEIRCDMPVWKSYIPITQSIKISAIRARTPINRGQEINLTNTDIGEVEVSGLRGHVYTEKNPPYGLIASRNLRINTFITDNLTDQPNLIIKGDAILITASSGNIVVKMNGVALENGTAGQQIRVKNTSSDRIVYAKVVSSSEVLVNY
ncbi:flagellar basal body P-ring formation chaperone FlgA [Marinomonas algarum]|uniref:Flagella basal body P-ring formation protein FlgA n=1 Tax=Marinomonas algarum TaxID=2883105 RepID=A0A9X1IPU7_9GAMM|nr:flagellar basal body P-ring formation chaperone FlgA [Marinomonas algarum]MCB5162844.1 flagellar basal body P-ring formation chaperone FlgA [Marinomonas algarum]